MAAAYWKLAVAVVIIVGAAVGLLSIGVLLFGRKLDVHVDSSKAMRERGVRCVREQDREARQQGMADALRKRKRQEKQ